MTEATKALNEAVATVDAMVQDGIKTFASDAAWRREVISIAASILKARASR